SRRRGRQALPSCGAARLSAVGHPAVLSRGHTRQNLAGRIPIAAALGAAILFGASTPAAKTLAGELHPVLLAGLLYAGSGVGLGVFVFLRGGAARIPRADIRWLAGAIVSGGVIGPVLLMLGLASTSAASASLLLNLEGVFTALLAWFALRENFDARIALGMALIVGGGALLAFAPGAVHAGGAG